MSQQPGTGHHRLSGEMALNAGRLGIDGKFTQHRLRYCLAHSYLVVYCCTGPPMANSLHCTDSTSSLDSASLLPHSPPMVLLYTFVRSVGDGIVCLNPFPLAA